MINYRIAFSKTGRASYISHLDLSKTITRALTRANIPAWFTLGYHPHMYITFSLPLSLGFESICETFDIKMEEAFDRDLFINNINSTLPEGISVLNFYELNSSPKDIFWGKYEINIYSDFLEFKDKFQILINKEEILVEKKSKKSKSSIMKEVNIKPLFRFLSFEENKLIILCRAGVEINLNPSLIFEALENETGFKPLNYKIKRIGILKENLEEWH